MPENYTMLQSVDVIDHASSAAKLVKSVFGKNSINRMAKDTMLQIPIIADASIHSQTLSVINKCIERRTAALLMSVFSLHPTISMKKFSSVGEYIRTFYDNDRSPIALPSSESSLEDALNAVISATESMNEDYTKLDSAIMYSEDDIKGKVDPQVQYEPFIGTEAVLNEKNLNDIFNPTKVNIMKMERALESMTAATEARGGHSNRFSNALAKADGALGKVDELAQSVHGDLEDLNMHSGSSIRPIPNGDGKSLMQSHTGVSSISVPKPVEGSLEPTLINATFMLTGEGTPIHQSVVIGIQSIARLLKYNDMVETLTTAATGSVGAFKAIKYLKGERNFADALLNIADAKAAARPKTAGEKVLSNLKRRKVDKIRRSVMGGPKPLPITWLVVSQAAVDAVKANTGIDLNEPYFALKLMEEYYFMGFMIVDESMDTVSSLLDGDTTFAETTVRALTSSNKSKYDLADDKVNTLLAQGRL